MIYVICICLIFGIIGAIWYAYIAQHSRVQSDTLIEQKNKELQQQKNSYEQEINVLNAQIVEAQKQYNTIIATTEEVTDNLKQYNERLKELQFINERIAAGKIEIASFEKIKSSLTQGYDLFVERLENNYTQTEEEYNNLIDKLNQSYFNLQQDQYSNFIEEQDKLQHELHNLERDLNKLKTTRAAAYEAQKREQKIQQEKAFYSLQLSPNLEHDLKLYNSIKDALLDKRPLLMAMWSAYYLKPANDLAARVLGANTVCGVYKITHESGLSYIGQARDVKERWREHVKCGLGIDTPSNNKLYIAMQEYGLSNFTFELLESCTVDSLNEKEKFYIDLYDSYNNGYNSNKGISK